MEGLKNTAQNKNSPKRKNNAVQAVHLNFHNIDDSIIECRGLFDETKSKIQAARPNSQNSNKYLLKKQKEYKVERASSKKSDSRSRQDVLPQERASSAMSRHRFTP